MDGSAQSVNPGTEPEGAGLKGEGPKGKGLTKDPLTGLYQQDYLMQQLSILLRQQKSDDVEASLALFQLENFYEIRRWVGKSEADFLLGDIARLLTQTLPTAVLLCRCSHYEFAALLPDEHSIHAHALIQRVKQALHSAVSDSIPPQLELKCAVGLAAIARSIPSAEVMFASARHNLSMALLRQRRSHILDSQHGEAVPTSLPQLLNILRSNELVLNFQPIVALKADGLRHYEVRCELPSSELSPSPSAVFEAAVKNALGERIDRWVVGKCLQILLQPDMADLRLTVNLTQNSLVSDQFFDWLRQQLAHDSTLTERLVLQISELDVLTAQHHMNSFSGQLTDLRLKLSISHFGCTADPFRYLPLVRTHFVKLDAALLDNLGRDQSIDEQLAKMTRRLHESGIRVIAAMVEDMEVVPLLWSAEVNFVQGFCWQEPVSELSFRFAQARVLHLDSWQQSSRTN